MNEDSAIPSKRFLSIAVIEHHQGEFAGLSAYDIAARLEEAWIDVAKNATSQAITSDVACIQGLQSRIALALGVTGGAFSDARGWSEFVEMCGSIDEAPGQVLSWHFSNLYWNQLKQLRLATSWFYMNAQRLQLNLPELDLRLEKVGLFLDSLSGSGPPLFDGQTFYPEDYADLVRPD